MSPVHAKITSHTFSHIGQRNENQDRLAVFEAPGDGSRLLVVADGLGGHSGGLLAAETVVNTAERCWLNRSSDRSPESFLKHLVRECHAEVCRAGREHALDPHSTIAALLLRDGQAISVHVGDSRVMQYSDKAFIGRTLDHSVAQLHALRGTITDDEIATHPDQNRLFAQIGGPAAPEAEIKHWDISAGRRFVLCSDGFWEIFRHDEIVELLASNDPDAALKDRFEQKLKHLAHHDNTTAILAEIVPGKAIPAPGPTPDPTPAPPSTEARTSMEDTAPEEVPASAHEPPTAQGQSRDSAAASGQTLVLFLVAALALAVAAIVAYAYRPGRSSPARWMPAGQGPRRLLLRCRRWERRIRVLAIFFGGQDHRRIMLKRVAPGS